jgi:hypothetical protein
MNPASSSRSPLVAVTALTFVLAATVGCSSLSSTAPDGGTVDPAGDTSAGDGASTDGSAGDGAGDTVTSDGGSSGDGSLDAADGGEIGAGDAADAGDVSPPTDGGTTADIAALDVILAAYRRGGTVDLDGDGAKETTILVNADGSKDVTTAGKKGLRERLHYVDARNLTDAIDEDGDGVFDRTETVSSAGKIVTRVSVEDRDADGTPDLRVTSTITPGASGAITKGTVEVWGSPPDGSAETWLTTGTVTDGLPPMADCYHPPTTTTTTSGGGSCWFDALGTWATEGVTHSVALYNDARVIVSGPNACAPLQVAQLDAAYRGAVHDVQRIGQINTTRLSAIYLHLSEGPLLYGCATPSCAPSGVVAITAGPEVPAFDDNLHASFTAVAPYVFSDGEFFTEEIVLHEWMHLGNVHHEKLDPNGNHARDWIYSCSRFANQWKAPHEYLGIIADASSSRDGARCATLDHKAQFGRGRTNREEGIPFTETSPGSTMTMLFCATDWLTTPDGAATCSVNGTPTYCDQTIIAPADRKPGELRSHLGAEACPDATPYVAAPCVAAAMSLTPELGRVPGCTAVPGAPF